MANVYVNSHEVRNHLRDHGMTMQELSYKMGRSESYVSYSLSRGYMSDPSYDAMCRALNVPHSTFIAPKEIPAPAETPTAYRLSLTYSDSKVLVQLMRGEEVVIGAWAIVKEQSELGFIQAISYAAHMMYKFAQQDDLNKEESA